MRRLTIMALALLAAFLCEDSAWAQGMGMMAQPLPGQKPLSMGIGNMRRPKRNLHKNRSPVLSPALNMVPGVTTSFEGQFLMRTLPQDQVYQFEEQTRKGAEGIQNRLDQQENQIKTGIGKTGHQTQFMNYGGYYQFNRGGGGRKR